MSSLRPIQPVILSGGSGSRLWPMSRELHPKQLLPLHGPVSMIRATLDRVSQADRYLPPIIVTNEALRFAVAEEARIGGRSTRIVLEPCARNTAPAITAAAALAHADDPETLLLVMPSDHVIGNLAAFHALVEAAETAARQGQLVTFAMAPTRPETGYGYIRLGPPLTEGGAVHAVAAFVEKPDAARAQDFVARGDHFWNSGMFLFSARTFLDEIYRHAPEVGAAATSAVARAMVDLDFIRLDAEAFAAAPSISIDYAVMERTDRAATVRGSIGWTDVGNWNELWSIGTRDEAGNVCQGDVVALDSRDCYLRSETGLIAAVGVENLAVVVTDDAVLVVSRDRAQDVKLVVEHLRAAGRSEQVSHVQVHRPWGFFQTLHSGERFQVKRLTLKPGAKISLQKHFHRAEHWVVVNGTAQVTCGEETRIVRENESIYIPLGEVHRLENPGKIPLNVIEVQSGSYLGEDDIVRFVDTYGRG
ncbi:mannose-1-phosphate guanylyltransferase (GDP) [Magnetospirillum fulvum]|uniref:mannose-1-phosphate guanylyltransferase n=2 Tax=Magnetospirillum fulvum TaxID=1082 RepID=A0A1H6H9Y4_MAGFU|nr:mannose-1-phosphate guanylyltransferase (GDP) [Magnetospirillum fulvum]